MPVPDTFVSLIAECPASAALIAADDALAAAFKARKASKQQQAAEFEVLEQLGAVLTALISASQMASFPMQPLIPFSSDIEIREIEKLVEKATAAKKATAERFQILANLDLNDMEADAIRVYKVRHVFAQKKEDIAVAELTKAHKEQINKYIALYYQMVMRQSAYCRKFAADDMGAWLRAVAVAQKTEIGVAPLEPGDPDNGVEIGDVPFENSLRNIPRPITSTPPELIDSRHVRFSAYRQLFQRVVLSARVMPVASWNHYFINILKPSMLRKFCSGKLGVAPSNSSKIRLVNIRFLKPMMKDRITPLFPLAALNSGRSYSASIVADIEYIDGLAANNEVKVLATRKDVRLFKFPVPVGSIACHLHGLTTEKIISLGEDPADRGGHFIIGTGNSTERRHTVPESLAFGQIVSSKRNNTIDTRVTLISPTGSVVLHVSSHTDDPKLSFSVSQSGMRMHFPSSAQHPVIVLFDAIAQMYKPNIYGYELPTFFGVEDEDLPDDAREAITELRAKARTMRETNPPNTSIVGLAPTILSWTKLAANRRGRILRLLKEMLHTYVTGPDETHCTVNAFFIASENRYPVFPEPQQEVVERHTRRSTNDMADPSTGSTISVKSVFQRATADYIADPTPEKLKRFTKAEDTLKMIKDGAVIMPDREDIAAAIIEDIAANIGPATKDMRQKLEIMAKLIAAACLTATGHRPYTDRDLMTGKRLRPAHETLAPILNSNTSIGLSTYGPKGRPETILNESFQFCESHDAIVHTFNASAAPGGARGSKQKPREDEEAAAPQLKRGSSVLAASVDKDHVKTPLPQRARSMPARMIDFNQAGFYCLFETPSSARAGLTKSIAVTAFPGNRHEEENYIADVFENYVENAGKKFFSQHRVGKFVSPVSIEMITVGWTNQPSAFAAGLRVITKRHHVYRDVSIAVANLYGMKQNKRVFVNKKRDQSVDIYTSGSRLVRPVFVVDEEKGDLLINMLPEGLRRKALFTWTLERLVREGLVELASALELSQTFIAQHPEHVKGEIQRRRAERQQWVDDKEKAKAAAAVGGRRGPELFEPVHMRMVSEIDPSAMFGLAVSMIPFANTNPGPRLNFQAGMWNQSQSLEHLFTHHRNDNMTKFTAVSRPLTETATQAVGALNARPNARMMMVAINATALTAEDAVALNADAFVGAPNGKTRVKSFRVKTTVDQNRACAVECISLPHNITEARLNGTENHATRQYAAVDDNGWPKPGVQVSEGMAVLSILRRGEPEPTPKTEFEAVGDGGRIKHVRVFEISAERDNSPKSLLVSVELEAIRAEEPGNKWASRFSQKGTAGEVSRVYSDTIAGPRLINWNDETVVGSQILAGLKAGGDPTTAMPENSFEGRGGALARQAGSVVAAAMTSVNRMPPQENDLENAINARALCSFGCGMPVVSEGAGADPRFIGSAISLGMNSHGLPTRMTAGTPQEGVLSFFALITSQRMDATPYTPLTDNHYALYEKVLENFGIPGNCKFNMQNPDNVALLGNRAKLPDGKYGAGGIFYTPMYYQKLVHQVACKIQSRNEGPMNRQSMQPMCGRSLGGGLRVGVMENAALVSSGAAHFLHERMSRSSDGTTMEFCGTCGRRSFLKFDGYGVPIRSPCLICKGTEIYVANVRHIFLLLTSLMQMLGVNVAISHAIPRRTILPSA